MAMFNHLLEIGKTESNGVCHRTRVRMPYFLTYQRKATDSGLYRWIDHNQQRGFHVTVSNQCTLSLTAVGIKQKNGVAELKIEVNGKILQSYIEDSKKKLNLLLLLFVGKFDVNDVINIKTSNLMDVKLTIYGQ